MAERHAALHAARALLLQVRDGRRDHELAEVRGPLLRVALRVVDPLDAQEGAELAHYAATFSGDSAASAASASASSRSARL